MDNIIKFVLSWKDDMADCCRMPIITTLKKSLLGPVMNSLLINESSLGKLWQDQLSSQFKLQFTAGEPLGVRNCSIQPRPVYFQWEEPKNRSCGEVKTDVTLEDVAEVGWNKPPKSNLNHLLECFPIKAAISRLACLYYSLKPSLCY